VGKVWFFGAEFNVNQSTLVPRTCTETIIEQTVRHCETETQTDGTFRIADIGTGSGCIAITLATTLPNCQITATDISEDALSLAQDNARLHGVEDQITFVLGDCTSPLQSLEPFDAICSNPPYIPDREFSTLDPNVRDWEPRIALSGGLDGLQVIRPLVETAPDCLVSNGMLIIEIATSIKDQVLKLAQTSSALKNESILKDQFGDDRFLKSTKT
jgi:release factor glutamine methyltransferase